MPMTVPVAGGEADGSPRRARWVAYGLIGLLAFCTLAGVEWWPLSSFRLFSQARTATAVSWQVALVDAAGDEHILPFDRLPRGYRGFHQLAPTLSRLSPGKRDAVCRAWAAADRLVAEPIEVRVYRVTGRVPTGHGPGPAPTRTLSVTCAGAGP